MFVCVCVCGGGGTMWRGANGSVSASGKGCVSKIAGLSFLRGKRRKGNAIGGEW